MAAGPMWCARPSSPPRVEPQTSVALPTAWNRSGRAGGRPMQRLRRASLCCSVAGLALLLDSAARAGAPIALDVPKIPAPAVRHIPLAVGLCLSPSLTTAVVTLEKNEAVLQRSPPNGDGKSWALGNAAAATITT